MDDFIYICDDAYQQQQFIAMESRIIRSLGFDINIPIPYRFLRRYARVSVVFSYILHTASFGSTLAVLYYAVFNRHYKSHFEQEGGNFSIARSENQFLFNLFRLWWFLFALLVRVILNIKSIVSLNNRCLKANCKGTRVKVDTNLVPFC